MQNKTNTKIIIDKLKLDTLCRLGCSDEVLLKLIKTGIYEPTGDSLIDQYLESLLTVKTFDNWGGLRKKQAKNHLDSQLDKQDDYHLDSQLADKDKDKDKDKDRDKDRDKDKDKNKDRVFKKPTLDNIRDYCISRNNNINPEQFYDYYEANGWKINRNPMKDWKATVRNWERNEFNRKSTDNFGLPIIEEPW